MKQILDPNDFVITRKRKKYRFAKFNNSTLCFEAQDWQKQSVDVIELGAGTGIFSVELATKYPNQQFVAIDIKGDRLQKGAYEAQARQLKNIRFLRARADQLEQLFPANSINKLWLTFLDPYPKQRSSGRRLTHPTFLSIYQKLLAKKGAIYLKHDSADFFQWSLEQLVAQSWHIVELSFDLHDSSLSNEYKIQTTYEQRWLGEGLVTKFVKAEK